MRRFARATPCRTALLLALAATAAAQTPSSSGSASPSPSSSGSASPAPSRSGSPSPSPSPSAPALALSCAGAPAPFVEAGAPTLVCAACALSGGAYDEAAPLAASGGVTLAVLDFRAGDGLVGPPAGGLGSYLDVVFDWDAAAGVLSLRWPPPPAGRVAYGGGALTRALALVALAVAGRDPTASGAAPSRHVLISIARAGGGGGGLAPITLVREVPVFGVNDAPVVSIAQPRPLPAWAEAGGGPPVALFPAGAASVADADDTSLSRVTITCEAGCVLGQDALALSSSGACAGGGGGGGGGGGAVGASAAGLSLALLGPASLAAFNAALACVVFSVPGAAGAPSLARRAFVVVATDAGGGGSPPGPAAAAASLPARAALAVAPFNDPPLVVLTGGAALTPGQAAAFYATRAQPPGAPAGTIAVDALPGGARFALGGAPVVVAPAVAVIDPDDANLSGAVVSIAGGTCAPGEDALAVARPPVGAGAGAGELAAAAARARDPLVWSYDAAACALVVSGRAPLAAYAALLSSVTYGDADGVSPSAAPRALTFVVTDDGAGGATPGARAASPAAHAGVVFAWQNVPPAIFKAPPAPPALVVDGAAAGAPVHYGGVAVPAASLQLPDDVASFSLAGAAHHGPPDSLGPGTGRDAGGLFAVDAASGALAVAPGVPGGALPPGAALGWRVDVTVAVTDRPPGSPDGAAASVTFPVFVVDAARAPALVAPAAAAAVLSDAAAPSGRLTLVHAGVGVAGGPGRRVCVDLAPLVAAVHVGGPAAAPLSGAPAAALLTFRLRWLAGAAAPDWGTAPAGAAGAAPPWSAAAATPTRLSDARLVGLFHPDDPLAWTRPDARRAPGVHCLSGSASYGPPPALATTRALASPRARVLHFRLYVLVTPGAGAAADAAGAGAAAWAAAGGATSAADYAGGGDDDAPLDAAVAASVDFDVDVAVAGCMDPHARYAPCVGDDGALVPDDDAVDALAAAEPAFSAVAGGPGNASAAGARRGVCANACVDSTGAGGGACDNACAPAGVAAAAASFLAGWAGHGGSGAALGGAQAEESLLALLSGACAAPPAGVAANPRGNFNPFATVPLSSAGSAAPAAGRLAFAAGASLGPLFPGAPRGAPAPAPAPSDGCVYPPVVLRARAALPPSPARLAAWRALAAGGGSADGEPLADWPDGFVHLTAASAADEGGVAAAPGAPGAAAGAAGLASGSPAAAMLALAAPPAALAAAMGAPASPADARARAYARASLRFAPAALDRAVADAAGVAWPGEAGASASARAAAAPGVYNVSLPVSLSRLAWGPDAPTPPFSDATLADGAQPGGGGLPGAPLLDGALLFSFAPAGARVASPYAPARLCVGVGAAPPAALAGAPAGGGGWTPRLYTAAPARAGAPGAWAPPRAWGVAARALAPLEPVGALAGGPPEPAAAAYDAAAGELCASLPQLPALAVVGWVRGRDAGALGGVSDSARRAPPRAGAAAWAAAAPLGASPVANTPELALYAGHVFAPAAALEDGSLPAFARALAGAPLDARWRGGGAPTLVSAGALAPPPPTRVEPWPPTPGGWPLHLDADAPRAWPAVAAGALFFAGDGGPGVGRELWRLDARAEGDGDGLAAGGPPLPARLLDLWPGARSSDPAWLVPWQGGALFFVANVPPPLEVLPGAAAYGVATTPSAYSVDAAGGAGRAPPPPPSAVGGLSGAHGAGAPPPALEDAGSDGGEPASAAADAAAGDPSPLTSAAAAAGGVRRGGAATGAPRREVWLAGGPARAPPTPAAALLGATGTRGAAYDLAGAGYTDPSYLTPCGPASGWPPGERPLSSRARARGSIVGRAPAGYDAPAPADGPPDDADALATDALGRLAARGAPPRSGGGGAPDAAVPAVAPPWAAAAAAAGALLGFLDGDAGFLAADAPDGGWGGGDGGGALFFAAASATNFARGAPAAPGAFAAGETPDAASAARAGGARYVDAGYELWALERAPLAPPGDPARGAAPASALAALAPRLVADINPGPASSRPADLVCWRGALYLSAYTPDAGREPWVYDVAARAARRVADVLPGPASSLARGAAFFTPFDGALVFAARDADFGVELFCLDPPLTTAGELAGGGGAPAQPGSGALALCADARPGAPSSYPSALLAPPAGGPLLFACERGAPAGRELCSWAGRGALVELAADLLPGGACAPGAAVPEGAEAPGAPFPDPDGCRAGGASSDPAGLVAGADGRVWLTARLPGTPAGERTLVQLLPPAAGAAGGAGAPPAPGTAGAAARAGACARPPPGGGGGAAPGTTATTAAALGPDGALCAWMLGAPGGGAPGDAFGGALAGTAGDGGGGGRRALAVGAPGAGGAAGAVYVYAPAPAPLPEYGSDGDDDDGDDDDAVGALAAVVDDGAAAAPAALRAYKYVFASDDDSSGFGASPPVLVAAFGVGAAGGPNVSLPRSPDARAPGARVGAALAFSDSGELLAVGAPGAGVVEILAAPPLGAPLGAWAPAPGAAGAPLTSPTPTDTFGAVPGDGAFGAALAFGSLPGGEPFVLVGAPGFRDAADAGAGAGAGAAWVFARRADGGWRAGARLDAAAAGAADAPGPGAGYGAAVAAGRALAFVGAPGAASGAGRVYAWAYDARSGSWALAPAGAGGGGTLSLPDAAAAARGGPAGAAFGAALALRNATLVVGAPGVDGAGGARTGAPGSGAVYVGALAWAVGGAAFPVVWREAGLEGGAAGVGGLGAAVAAGDAPPALLAGGAAAGAAVYGPRAAPAPPFAAAPPPGAGPGGAAAFEPAAPPRAGAPLARWPQPPAAAPPARLALSARFGPPPPVGAADAFGAAVAVVGASAAVGAPGAAGGRGLVALSFCSAPACAPGAYAARFCSAGGDRACAPCATGACAPGHYEAAPCGRAADRVCARCSGGCPPGTVLAAPCGPASDRVCAAPERVAAAAAAAADAAAAAAAAAPDATAPVGWARPSTCVADGTCVRASPAPADVAAAAAGVASAGPVVVEGSAAGVGGGARATAAAAAAAAPPRAAPADARALRALGSALGFDRPGGAWGASSVSAASSNACGWPGVECDADGRVVRLAVSGGRGAGGGPLPRGTPPCLGLPRLRALALEGAGVVGPLPPSLCSCPELARLSLARSGVRGPLPACLAAAAVVPGREGDVPAIDGAAPPAPSVFSPTNAAVVRVLPALESVDVSGCDDLPLAAARPAWFGDALGDAAAAAAGGDAAAAGAPPPPGELARALAAGPGDGAPAWAEWNAAVLTALARRGVRVDSDAPPSV